MNRPYTAYKIHKGDVVYLTMGGDPHTQEPKSARKKNGVAQDAPSSVPPDTERRQQEEVETQGPLSTAFLSAKPGT